ncbi:MAG: sigma 54-interacting transcriptional regulator [Clostridia bacterium]|nr:sigma 54-interacting transcriptional regulator [Clostridia bacterium]
MYNRIKLYIKGGDGLGNVIEIPYELQNTIDELAKQQGICIEELIKKAIEEYGTSQETLNNITAELEIFKERQLHAFAIGDAIYDGIYVIDNKGVIVAVNKIYTEMAGITEEELIGKPVQILIEKKIFEKEVSLKALEQNVQKSGMCTIIRSNKQVLKTSNPIRNEKGKAVGVLTVIRDITELIKLKEELENSEKVNRLYLDELNYFRMQEMAKMGLIGDSPSMILVKDLILNVSQVDASVLISGETGVGKEVVAREIVKNSPRKNGPYIKVNCAAIPENLLESELFGYEKGAFTGALNKNKIGYFEMANGGTILLDEIGDMPLNLQSKLLRVIQEKELIRVGGNTTIPLDVRVIASTNVNIEKKIKEGTFREDLYYRLNVIPIKIPSLRMRKEDIPLLVNYFLKDFNRKYNKNISFDRSAIEILYSHEWPGNVRELENIVERLVVIENEEKINAMHVKKILTVETNIFFFESGETTLEQAVKLVEKQIILNALQKYKSTHKAAEALGVSQPTVSRKARSLGIQWDGCIS